jgi:hypothetical protein
VELRFFVIQKWESKSTNTPLDRNGAAASSCFLSAGMRQRSGDEIKSEPPAIISAYVNNSTSPGSLKKSCEYERAAGRPRSIGTLPLSTNRNELTRSPAGKDRASGPMPLPLMPWRFSAMAHYCQSSMAISSQNRMDKLTTQKGSGGRCELTLCRVIYGTECLWAIRIGFERLMNGATGTLRQARRER